MTESRKQHLQISFLIFWFCKSSHGKWETFTGLSWPQLWPTRSSLCIFFLYNSLQHRYTNIWCSEALFFSLPQRKDKLNLKISMLSRDKHQYWFGFYFLQNISSFLKAIFSSHTNFFISFSMWFCLQSNFPAFRLSI